MADALLSDSDVGIGGGSSPAPSSASSSLMSDADVGLNPGSSSTASASAAPQQSSSPQSSSGPLSNSSDDGWISGAAKGLGTAAIRGVSSIPGAVGDLGNLLKLTEAGARQLRTGENYQTARAAVDAAEAQNDTAFQNATGVNPNMPTTQDVEGGVESALGTGRYDPSTALGRIAQGAASTAIGGAAFGGAGALASNGAKIGARTLADAALSGVTPNAVAGAAGQGAAEVSDNPYVGLAAGLVAPVATERALTITPIGRNARVGKMLQNTATDPNAVRQSLGLGDVVDGASSSAIPGSKPTTGQATGDYGLLRAENDARTANNVDWNARDADQNSARRAALSGLQPNGDAMAPAQSMRDHLNAVDQLTQNAIDHLTDAHSAAVDRINSGLDAETTARDQATRGWADQQNDALAARTSARNDAATAAADSASQARQALQDQLTDQFAQRLSDLRQQAVDGASSIGPRVNPEDAGALLRGSIAEAEGQATTIKRGLYKAVDPDGTLNSVVTPLKQAQSDILGSIDPNFGVQPSGPEAAIWNDISRMPDVVPFRSLQTLDGRVTAAMSEARRNPDPNDPQAISRLTQLKGAVLDAINSGVDNQQAYEQRGVAAGAIDPQQTINARLQTYTGRFGDGGGGPSGGRAAYGADQTRSAAPSGIYRAGVETGRGLGDLSGGSNLPDAPAVSDQVVRRPTPPVEPRPQDLVGFIKAHGGMQDPGGDLQSLGLGDIRGVIAKPGQGLHPDRMREAAAEAGYLGHDVDHAMANTTVNDLLDHMVAPNPVYSAHDEDLVQRWDAHDQAKADYDRYRDDPQPISARPRGRPLSSYSEADIYPPGTGPSEQVKPGLKPNFDQGAADRLAAAKAAHIDYVKTYDQGPVEKALANNGFVGQYKLQDGRVAASAVVAGPSGYETTRSFLKAAKSDPEAVKAMQQIALNNLRNRLGPDGSVTNASLTKWKTDYAGALRALDEASLGFSKTYDGAAKATQALVDEGARQKVAMEAYNRDLATQATAEKDSRETSLKLANVSDRDATRSLIGERLGDDADLNAAAKARARAAIAESKHRTGSGVSQAISLQKQARAMPGTELASKTAPSEVERAMGDMLLDRRNGPTRVRSLVTTLSRNSDALDGALKAAADFISNHVLNAGDAGASGKSIVSSAKLSNLLKDNRAAIEALFPRETVNTLQAISADMKRADMTRTATENRGQSPTSKNLHALVKKASDGAHGHSIMSWALGTGGVEILGHLMEHGITGHTLAAAAGTGLAMGVRKVVMRENEIRRAMFTDALMNPERARFYLERVPPGPRGVNAVMGKIATSVRRQLIAQPVLNASQSRSGYATGGAIGRRPLVAPRRIDVQAAAQNLSDQARRIRASLAVMSGRATGLAPQGAQI